MKAGIRIPLTDLVLSHPSGQYIKFGVYCNNNNKSFRLGGQPTSLTKTSTLNVIQPFGKSAVSNYHGRFSLSR
jgi:hypothetical protein